MTFIDVDYLEEGLLNEGGMSRIVQHFTKPFAIISAFRDKYSLRENRARNRRLESDLKKLGAGGIKLIGHWLEAPDGTPWEAALASGDVNDVVEESYFVPKPKGMDREDFFLAILGLVKKYQQDAGIVGDNGRAFLLMPSGDVKSLGKATIGRVSQAYSRLRGRPQTFVFEGTMHPSSNAHRHLLKERSVLWIPRVQLDERIVTFGGRAFPKEGQLVFMAGGPGSGKGFVLRNIVGVHGKVVNSDDLLETVAKLRGIDLGNPKNVEMLYDELKPKHRRLLNMLLSQERRFKDNIIIDGTGKDLVKFTDKVFPFFKKMGYDITLVYVFADKDIAWQRNLARRRVVPEDIFNRIHNQVGSSVKNTYKYFDHVWYVDNSLSEPNWWVKYPERVVQAK